LIVIARKTSLSVIAGLASWLFRRACPRRPNSLIAFAFVFAALPCAIFFKREMPASAGEQVLAALPLHTHKCRPFNHFLGRAGHRRQFGAGGFTRKAAHSAHLPNSRGGANRRVAKVGIWQYAFHSITEMCLLDRQVAKMTGADEL
jgi:hypothetical protein